MADKSFAEYVQDVMAALPTVNRGLMTGTVSPDADKYREDPLWKSRAIKAAAEEEAKKKAILDEVLTSPVQGGESRDQGLDPQVAAFLDAETPAARDARLGFFQQAVPGVVAGMFGIPTSGMPSFGQVAGLTDARGMPTYAGALQAGQQYNATPGWLRGMIPFSASTIAASTPMGLTNPQQTATLAAQYEAMGYSPEAAAGLSIASQESAQGNPDGTYSDGGDYGD